MVMKKLVVSSKQQAKNLNSKTDWNKVKKLTDADIQKAIASDPDARELKDYELSQMKPFKFIKMKLGL